NPPHPRCAGLFCAGLFLAALLPLSAPAGPPVAVTEVLTAPSSEDGEDFWELTNYGTNVVDLEELRFSDDSRLA
ncbi:MAG TPA: hypothetical protein PKE47_15365, partial [Verrucomicrobiota bacterium]|nr:hypothetical protein [Verrucomicrobiota bacterium]